MALKKLLVSAPVLQLVHPNKPYTSQTVVSSLGLGAILSQVGADGHIMDMDTPSLMPVESYFPETGKLHSYSEGEFGHLVGLAGVPHYLFGTKFVSRLISNHCHGYTDEGQQCTLDEVGSVLTALLLLAVLPEREL